MEFKLLQIRASLDKLETNQPLGSMSEITLKIQTLSPNPTSGDKHCQRQCTFSLLLDGVAWFALPLNLIVQHNP